MKVARFIYKKEINWGIVEGEQIFLLKEEPYKKIIRLEKEISLAKIKLLVPATPSKIICVGLNYRDHAAEMKMPLPSEPVIFLKPNTSLIAHQKTIVYPKESSRVDYEAELAIVIKKQGRNIHQSRAKEYILGYTCLNDVTARDLQKKDGQWTRSKSFDTFCPVGPWIETDIDSSRLKIKAILNNKIVQESNTANFIFRVDTIVAFISRIMTLLPGDIISTGTPAGIGPMKKNDKITVEIEGIGRLDNRVA
jgi:2-keto-4-pentenoate hydratase/2-oxohepta-3-ene-1,7-dioic acid hydratase in catechol pathway